MCPSHWHVDEQRVRRMSMDGTYLGNAGNSLEYLSDRIGPAAAEGSSGGISVDVGLLVARRDRLNGPLDHIVTCTRVSDAVANPICDWTSYRQVFDHTRRVENKRRKKSDDPRNKEVCLPREQSSDAGGGFQGGLENEREELEYTLQEQHGIRPD